MRYAVLTETAALRAGRAEAAREREVATAARYAGRASYCSLQASSTSGQPQAVARAARACMMKETPSHRRLTLVPLSSWVPPKSASIEDQSFRNSRSKARRLVASRRAEPVADSTPAERPAMASARPRLTESKCAPSARESWSWWPKGAPTAGSNRAEVLGFQASCSMKRLSGGRWELESRAE